MISKFLYKIMTKIGIKISNAGNRIHLFGVNIQSKSMDWFKKAHKQILTDEDQMKENIIAAQVKKGGCEVQTGNFRRIDCSDNTERSKRYFAKMREQNIKHANERMKEINMRIDQTEKLIGVKERIDEV